jgi:hypothetical protein
MRPEGWRRGAELTVTLPHACGQARVSQVRSRLGAGTARQIHLSADVAWVDGRRPSLASGLNGISFDEQIELGLRAGLLGEALPERLGMLAGAVDSSDPLAPLDELGLAQAVYAPVARLLLVERLLGAGGASRVHEAIVGPEHAGRRAVQVAWTESMWAMNVTPGRRQVTGWREARGTAGA